MSDNEDNSTLSANRKVFLERIYDLIDNGIGVIPVRPRSKAPIEKAWASKPIMTVREAKRAFSHDENVGVRLGRFSQLKRGYLHGIDVDIRNRDYEDEACTALTSIIGSYKHFNRVRSGSGGSSFHIYFLSDEPFDKKLLLRSEGTFEGPDGQVQNWQVELGGSGQQFVYVGSTHPSGGTYSWINEPRDINDLIFVPSQDVAKWIPEGLRQTNKRADGEYDLVNSIPGDFTIEQVNGTIEILISDPLSRNLWCNTYHGWLKAGMALHHQFQGSGEGLERWHDMAAQGDCYDAGEIDAKWGGFGRGTGRFTKFRTLVRAANKIRAARIEEMEDPPTDEDLVWLSSLERTDANVIKSTIGNVRKILAHDTRLRGVIAENEFTHEVVQMKDMPRLAHDTHPIPLAARDRVNGALWTDFHDACVRAFIAAPGRATSGSEPNGYGIKIAGVPLSDAVLHAARGNRFHPVKQYLRGLQWDGRKRMNRIFVEHLGCPDTPYHRAVGRIMLLAAVTRVFEPGHKYDYAVILEGIEGKGKSTFIKTLAVNWFGELAGSFHDRKSMVEQMQGCWIMELPELSSLQRSETTDVKQFMSAESDKVRLSYARRAENFLRQCIFIGSTNDSRYLQSETGNRRFHPVLCTVSAIDIESFREEVNQYWAEAYSTYLNMRDEQPEGDLPLYLTGEAAQEEALAMQSSRKTASTAEIYAGQIQEFLDTPLRSEL